MTGFHTVHIAWPVTAFHLSWQKLWRTWATTSKSPLAGLVNDRPALSLMRLREMKEEVENSPSTGYIGLRSRLARMKIG